MLRPPSISQNEASTLLSLLDFAEEHAPTNPFAWAKGFLYATLLGRGRERDPFAWDGPPTDPPPKDPRREPSSTVIGRVEVVKPPTKGRDK